MQIALLAFDLDGTFLKNDHLTVSEHNLAALRAVIEKGVIAVPATGRARGRLPEFLDGFPGIRYAITSNGAKLNDLETGETLYHNTLPFDTVERLFHALESFPVYLELYADGNCYAEASREVFFNEMPLPPNRREMMARNRTCIPELLNYLRERSRRVEKLNLPFLLPEQQEPIHNLLQAFPELAVTSSLPQNAEINAPGCNKGDALAHLCAILGIGRENVMALGDNGNDVELLKFAGTAAAPSNAADCAKAVAHTLMMSNEEDFAAHALKKWIHI